jgi:hypothetical protein
MGIPVAPPQALGDVAQRPEEEELFAVADLTMPSTAALSTAWSRSVLSCKSAR